MELTSWDVAQRSLSNRMDSTATESKIYITARKTSSRDNQRLSTTRFHIVFGVVHRTLSNADRTNEFGLYFTCHDFDHPFDRFAFPDEAKAVVAAMISSQQIPFSLGTERGQSLHWKEVIADETPAIERIPLQGFDDVITRISQAAARVAREASASGRKAVQMVVTIDKRTAIPPQEFEKLMSPEFRMCEPQIFDPEDPRLCWNIDHAYIILSLLTSPIFPRFTRRSAFARHRSEDDVVEDDNDDRTELDHNHEQGEFSRTIEQSFSQSAVAFESVPASRSVVEAPEKLRYERSSEDEDNPKCMICMEELMSGSYLTRMPCLHVYHFDCISQWLHNNHTCPICRFKLPIK